jgi:hypothetical protein
MVFSEFERKKYEKAFEAFMEKRRPAAKIRDQVDLGYRITGQSVEIFEIRALWDDPAQKIEAAIAKATFVKKHNVWQVFWCCSSH